MARGRTEAAPLRRYQLRWTFGGAAADSDHPSCWRFLPLGLGGGAIAMARCLPPPMAFVPVTLSSALFRYRPGISRLTLRRAIRGLSVAFFTFGPVGGVGPDRPRGSSALPPVRSRRRRNGGADRRRSLPEIRHVTHLALDRLTWRPAFVPPDPARRWTRASRRGDGPPRRSSRGVRENGRGKPWI